MEHEGFQSMQSFRRFMAQASDDDAAPHVPPTVLAGAPINKRATVSAPRCHQPTTKLEHSPAGVHSPGVCQISADVGRTPPSAGRARHTVQNADRTVDGVPTTPRVADRRQSTLMSRLVGKVDRY